MHSAALVLYPVLASRGGQVISAGWNDGGYGYLVEIRHDDGSLSRYAHNSQIVVRRGDIVKRGQVVAKVGNSGRSTGPHLHFEVMVDGVPQDPERFLAAGAQAGVRAQASGRGGKPRR